MSFPGGLLIGDDAGTLNFAKIKGSHTAMKSGMVAAETVAEALAAEQANTDLEEYAAAYKSSWAYKELHMQRNFGPASTNLAILLVRPTPLLISISLTACCPGPERQGC